MAENHKKWAEQVPPDLMPAVKALRKGFEDAHWKFGRLTQALCFNLLHQNDLGNVREYLPSLQNAKMIVGLSSTQRFSELLKLNTLPAIFRGFFNFYMEGVTVTMLSAFKDLVEIGRANATHLDQPHLKWAMAQTQAMIYYHTYAIPSWIREVCDTQVYDPSDEFDEFIFWRKWQAPSFIVMKPSLHQPYEPDRVWERMGIESSLGILKHFSEEYGLHLEVKMKRVAGEEAVRQAKEPKPMAPPAVAPDANPHVHVLPVSVKSSTIKPRREAGKLGTQAMYRTWQREYKALSKRRPDMSDVWYAQQIAKMPIAKGKSAASIRRRMKL